MSNRFYNRLLLSGRNSRGFKIQCYILRFDTIFHPSTFIIWIESKSDQPVIRQLLDFTEHHWY